MRKLTSKKVLAATVAGLAVAGGGAAIAASQSDSSGSSFLDGVARHLGISSQELVDATRAAAIDQVDQALKDGRLTQEQADALKERIESADIPAFLGPGLFGPGHRFGPDVPGGRHMFLFGDKLDAAADYLGLTEAELREQLGGGSSLADVAKAQGKSVEGLEQAILKAARSSLDEAVEAGRLTKEQADAFYERLEGAVGDIVDGNLPELRHGRGFGGPGLAPPGFAPDDDGGDDDGGSGGDALYWDTAA
jgi:hypothetical protein